MQSQPVICSNVLPVVFVLSSRLVCVSEVQPEGKAILSDASVS